MITNVLAERYATAAMTSIWSTEGKIRSERHLWIAVLRGQQALGLNIPDEAIAAYEAVVDSIDLESIERRERVLRHDVNARIEEFNALAGYQFIHQGMTSRDLTDNVEMMQIRNSLRLVQDRAIAVLRRFGARAMEFRILAMCGRSHNVPGQVTTLGHRFGMWGEEMLEAFASLEALVKDYPLRGMKGAMGTQQDMMALLKGADAARALDERVMNHFEFDRTLRCTGQVYPRSLDFDVIATLAQLASGPANFALNVRLMAGQQQVHEGFGEGQTGSTAMPHKMNARTCERIRGLMAILRGHVTMASDLLGDQWAEGDVSCSVVRRVIFPDAFLALDGLFESAMTVLDQMAFFPSVIERELNVELPFLATSRVLMAALEKKMGRESAHTIIKKHAIEALQRIRTGTSGPDFVVALANDPDFLLTEEEIRACLVPEYGRAAEQAVSIATAIVPLLNEYPEGAAYDPAPIR